MAGVAVGGVTGEVASPRDESRRSNFDYAFRILPPERRRAIRTLYGFCRAVDDCVDEEDGGGEAGLGEWAEEVERCYTGAAPRTALGRDLSETVARFPVPRAALDNVIEGCRMDLTTSRYATFAELRVYCERVASAVGLASIEIFGYEDPRTREYAVELGIALQLTNVLRDIAQDAARGRLYLPLEDLRRFEVGEDHLLGARFPSGAPPSSPLRRLLEFEVARARGHYAAAARLLPDEDRRSMLAARIMGAIYRAVLEEFARRGCPVGGERTRIGRLRKAWLTAATAARALGGR